MAEDDDAISLVQNEVRFSKAIRVGQQDRPLIDNLRTSSCYYSISIRRVILP